MRSAARYPHRPVSLALTIMLALSLLAVPLAAANLSSQESRVKLSMLP